MHINKSSLITKMSIKLTVAMRHNMIKMSQSYVHMTKISINYR